jgi:hypothetical protein
MANLGPLQQNLTYGNLLQVDGGLSSELKPVLDGNGNESGLSLSYTAVGITGFAAEFAANLYGGIAGTIPFQSGSNVTAFTTVGDVGTVLTSNGSSAPYWSNLVENATNAAFASDISGGASGQLLYQSGTNDTSFVTAGVAGQALISAGNGAPYWSNTVISAQTATSASNIAGGTAGNLLYQSGSGATEKLSNGTTGQVLKSQGSLAPVWSTLTASDVNAVPVNGSVAMTGDLHLGGFKVTNVGAPTVDTDAATKSYVDSVATGLKIKAACRVATTANITLSGTPTVDGVTVSNLDRVLVKNQTSLAENGIYVVNSSGSWGRATDADTWAELVGATCFITAGTANANTTWACNIASSGSLGVDPIVFVLFGASAAYTAGTGLSLVGSQFSLATPVSVSNGGSGASTLTGIVKGNGTSAFSAADASDVINLIGSNAVANATTAASCSGNSLTATTLQTARTINGISFNGSANITVTANTPDTLTFATDGLGDVGFTWSGSTVKKVSYNTIGSPSITGVGASGTWPINVSGTAASVSGVVGATNGGTGIASYATGDLLYASNTNVLSKLATTTNGNVLISGSLPSWGKVGLTTHVSGILPIGSGGTGATTAADARTALGAGTVTSITAGTGLSGGAITTAGTIALANTTVTPGSYTAANITVDQQGRITAAANGSGGGSVGPRLGEWVGAGYNAPTIATPNVGGFLIGGGSAAQPNGSYLSCDGEANFVRLQVSKNYNTTELIVYSSSGQGYVNTNGTSVTLVWGSNFDSAWISGWGSNQTNIYIGGTKYKIASINSSSSITLTTSAGVQTDVAYNFFYVSGSGTCNVSGGSTGTLTFVSGDPFTNINVYLDGQFKLNGQLVSISFVSASSVTYSGYSGTPPASSSFEWRGNINNQLTTLRVQSIQGENEENVNLMALAADAGGEGRCFALCTGLAGTYGRYRPLMIGSGEYSSYNYQYQAGFFPAGSNGYSVGYVELGGVNNKGALKVLAPSSDTANGAWWEMPAAGTGNVVLASRGAANRNINIDTTGTGSVYFTSGTYTSTNLAVYGNSGSTSWLAIGGSSSNTPALDVAGAASDISILIRPKGNGGVRLSAQQSNYLVAYGSSGDTPGFGAEGSASNIDVVFNPKGSGLIRFGTYAAGATSVVGYIQVKDFSGVVRKLAVIS